MCFYIFILLGAIHSMSPRQLRVTVASMKRLAKRVQQARLVDVQ